MILENHNWGLFKSKVETIWHKIKRFRQDNIKLKLLNRKIWLSNKIKKEIKISLKRKMKNNKVYIKPYILYFVAIYLVFFALLFV